MQYLHFGTHRALRTLGALVVGIVWCAVSVASSGTESDWWRWRDNVTISGAPAPSVTVGQSYSFTPSATDSRNRTLVFAIYHKPAWASFSTSTGQLAGAPAASNVGTYANIVIAASDGRRTATLPAFSIQVLAGSATSPPPTTTPPTISGTPPTSDVAGTAYAFQPNASGPSGMTLAFSVQNKPAWANFSIATGMLSGTPTTSQTGTYSNIVLSVSDGVASSSLAPFTITVTQATPTTGNATVNWVAPTQNTNGTALTDLAGLRIYYGTSSSNLTQMVQVSTTQTSTTISNLASGVWYFGGVAYTTAGTQSAMSSVVSATIP
jgi:hypothetical protein